MLIYKLLERGTFYDRQTQTLISAFEEALCLADVQDPTGPRARRIAERIIAAFLKGEIVATRIAERAIEE